MILCNTLQQISGYVLIQTYLLSGVPYPKGMYDIGLPSGKTLYQIQVERILRLEKMAQNATEAENKGNIFMYVMTSEHTKKPTEEFFEKHKYFGSDKSKIIFFEQRMIPCFDFDGKIILESPTKIARAPDGNGGLYWALKNESILDHMEENKVCYLHVYCVDNVLVKVADPIFMGYCIEKGAESGIQCILHTTYLLISNICSIYIVLFIIRK